MAELEEIKKRIEFHEKARECLLKEYRSKQRALESVKESGNVLDR